MRDRTRFRRAGASAVAAVLLVGGLGACSDEDADGDSVDEEIESVESTVDSAVDDAESTASSVIDDAEREVEGED